MSKPTKPTADDDIDRLSTEIHIDYIGGFDGEVSERTVDATIIHDGERVRIKTAESELRLYPEDSGGSIRLYSEYDINGNPYDNLAFIPYEADNNRIRVSWKHTDRQVDAIELCDDAYQMVLDMVNEARDAQDHLTVEEASNKCGVKIPAIPLVVTEANVSRGTGTGRQTNTELVVSPDPNKDVATDTWELWRSIVQRAGEYQLTHYKNHMWPPEGKDYEQGDQLTLHEYINEWHAIDARDVATEADLAAIRIETDLAVGDIVTVSNGRHRDNQTKRNGVVREISDTGAEITWDGWAWSKLYHDDNGQLRIGRAGGYSPVRELTIHDVAEIVDDKLLEVRKNTLESADTDQRANEYTVTVEDTWETTGAVEAERASDLHAKLTIDGPGLDTAVTVHCRNAFDIGWTASIDADLDEKTSTVVKRAARNNSPIPTQVRL